MFRFFFQNDNTKPIKFYFYSLKQESFSSVNYDNMAIQSSVISHMTYGYINIHSKISYWNVT